jgi:diacylglycerol kinase (ATP)
MKSSISIIYNPAARKASKTKVETASSFLRGKGFDTEILITEKRGHAEQLARESVKNKPSLIIAAGGDGTINEVINGIVWSGVPLSLLPLGTTNVLAKELGLLEDVCGSMEAAAAGRPRTVSLGRIDMMGGKLSRPRYFCLMAGIGFDGKTVYDVDSSLKRVSGATAYIVSGIRNLLSYSLEEISFTIDGRNLSGYSAIIGKARRYGGNFQVTPDADLLEPSLYTVIFKGRRRRDLLRYAFGIIRGSHLKYRDILYMKSTDIEIGGTAHIQIDGDYLGVSPARVSVVKDALKLVY